MVKMKSHVNVLVSKLVTGVSNTKNTDELKLTFLVEKLYKIC